jgi:hypothetical protein
MRFPARGSVLKNAASFAQAYSAQEALFSSLFPLAHFLIKQFLLAENSLSPSVLQPSQPVMSSGLYLIQ